MGGLRLTNHGLARRMRDASQLDGGKPLATSNTNIAKYLAGQHTPTPRVCQVMLNVLGQLANHHLTPADIGFPNVRLELDPRVSDLSGISFPPRFTFAGVCIWCHRRGCNDQRCRDRHRGAQWAICSLCDGAAIECTCTFGMIAITTSLTATIGEVTR
ncbi:hypothetical protein [Nocardia seriolae]|nr:hypothetical protein [Nocardia seriolae]MTJ60570.1 hypothetical protein [Nocardia seriolae]MTK38554.1 hypothetical protein [Nocardia seriolae]OJF83109.1 hypothetical protein NS14008_33315 [Nocardia seriolae]PSK27111.1 hypothetical protein C6575_33685 [Nocardia seriolae]QOW32726.1 hypothetical protein IMZ23_33205 [Nocardia seriolae]